MTAKSRSVALLFSFFLVWGLLYSAAYCQGEIWRGMTAPPFTLEDAEGVPTSLADQQGSRATVLVFWATWSANSHKELTRLDQTYRKLGESGLSVIGINVDKQTISAAERERVAGRVKEWGVSFPSLFDAGLDTFHRYGVVAVPTTVILDGQGIIRYILPGYPLEKSEEMFEFLDALVSGKPVAAAELTGGYRPNPKAVRYYELGKKTLSKGKIESALRYLRMSQQLDPSFVAVRLTLGKVYDQSGRKQEAEAAYRSALEIEPQNAVALAQLGHILLETERQEEAAELLKKAVTLDQSYSPAHYYYGLALGRAGFPERAAEHFKAAEELNPLDYRLYLARAEFYAQTNSRREAAEAFRWALEILAGYDRKPAGYARHDALRHFTR